MLACLTIQHPKHSQAILNRRRMISARSALSGVSDQPFIGRSLCLPSNPPTLFWIKTRCRAALCRVLLSFYFEHSFLSLVSSRDPTCVVFIPSRVEYLKIINYPTLMISTSTSVSNCKPLVGLVEL